MTFFRFYLCKYSPNSQINPFVHYVHRGKDVLSFKEE